MFGMTWSKLKVLIAIYVKYIEIWGLLACFIELINKFDIIIKVINFHHKIFETMFAMSLDEENIINVPKKYKRLKLWVGKNLLSTWSINIHA